MYIILILSLLVVVGMVAGRCLCCTTCIIFSDDFSSDRLAEYTVSGSPTVGGGRLASSGGNFQAIPNATGTTGSGRVTVTTTTDDAADNIELWGAYTDASNYVFLRLLNGEVKLYQRLFGANTQLGSTGVDIDIENHDVHLCLQWNGTRVKATVQWSNSEISYDQSCAMTGDQVGVLVTGTGNCFFDDLVFKEHYDEDSTCGQCDDDCTIFEDDFSTDLLTTDYATTGTPSVASGVLSLPHPATVRSLSTAPDECDGIAMSCRVKMPDTTKEVDIYLGVNNILRLQAGSPSGTAELYFAGALVHTETVPVFEPDEWVSVCFCIDNSDGGDAVAKLRVGSASDEYYAGTPAVLANRAVRIQSNAAGTAEIDDLRYYRSEYDKFGCGDCLQGSQGCDEDEFIILIYNHNSARDDNFSVRLNGAEIGTIDNSADNTCTGRIFSTDTSITSANLSGLTCGAPTFEATVELAGVNRPTVGNNTLQIISTTDANNGNFGTVWVGYVSWDGTNWEFCRQLLSDSYAHNEGVGNSSSYSFAYP